MTRYAWFSHKMADVVGSVVWVDQHGVKFQVTTVTDSDSYPGSKWGDEVCIGAVLQYLSGELKSWNIPDGQSRQSKFKKKRNDKNRSHK